MPELKLVCFHENEANDEYISLESLSRTQGYRREKNVRGIGDASIADSVW